MSLTLPIREVRAATPRTRIIRIDLGEGTLAYRAGQALFVRPPGRPAFKPYSIASSPLQSRAMHALELLVQRSADDDAAHLADLNPGDVVDVEGPIGAFGLPDPLGPWRQLLFVAGGTGIAPLRAMLWSAIEERPPLHLSLLYSARSGDEFAYRDEFRQLKREGRLHLVETVTREAPSWTGPRGRISLETLASLDLDAISTLAFVCGPAPLVRDLTVLVGRLGIPERQILTERWGS